MHWKDYFYFSKSQRIGLIILIMAIIGISFGNLLLDSFVKPNKNTDDSKFRAEVSAFKKSLKDNTPRYSKHKYQKTEFAYTKTEWNKTSTVILSDFNPNTLDSAGFLRLGLKSFQAKNILKFRTKGGKFKSPDDFAKVYGLSATQFSQLKPYIKIPTERSVEEKTALLSIELNSADSCQLCQIKGMSPSMAKRIIVYGKKLGGYVAIAQLEEVWGMKPELLEKIKIAINISKVNIRKISINKAGIDQLRSHPYINFYQAKAIYEYRKNKGHIKSFQELKELENEYLDNKFLSQMEPYFEFNSRY